MTFDYKTEIQERAIKLIDLTYEMMNNVSKSDQVTLYHLNQAGGIIKSHCEHSREGDIIRDSFSTSKDILQHIRIHESDFRFEETNTIIREIYDLASEWNNSVILNSIESPEEHNIILKEKKRLSDKAQTVFEIFAGVFIHDRYDPKSNIVVIHRGEVLRELEDFCGDMRKKFPSNRLINNIRDRLKKERTFLKMRGKLSSD